MKAYNLYAYLHLINFLSLNSSKRAIKIVKKKTPKYEY